MLTFILLTVFCTFMTYSFLPLLGVTGSVQLFFISPCIGLLLGYIISRIAGYIFGTSPQKNTARYPISKFEVWDGDGFTKVKYSDDSVRNDLEDTFYKYEIECDDTSQSSAVLLTTWTSPSSLLYLGPLDDCHVILCLTAADYKKWSDDVLTERQKENEAEYA